jgi:hypothetical protein
MQISWAVGYEPDPRLERLFRGVRGQRAAPAVREGVAVYVTAAEEHDSAYCPLSESHDCTDSVVRSGTLSAVIWSAPQSYRVRLAPRRRQP